MSFFVGRFFLVYRVFFGIIIFQGVGRLLEWSTFIMLDLLEKKDILLTQLHHYVNTLGLTHPYTVKKSQELDVIINEIVFQDIEIQKRAG